MFRRTVDSIEVFLVHPGGPFWARKDKGAWSIPKGKFLSDEEPMDAARREFMEETSFPVSGDLLHLGSIQQANGKLVHAWAFEGDADPTRMVSNTCEIEWPPRSGRTLEIPEVDRGAWFSVEAASHAIVPGQLPFLHRLQEHSQTTRNMPETRDNRRIPDEAESST